MKHFIGIRFSRYGQVRIGSFENINEETFLYGQEVLVKNENAIFFGNVVWQSDHLASLCASHQKQQTNLDVKKGQSISENDNDDIILERDLEVIEPVTRNIIRTKGPFAESFEATQVQQYSFVRLATDAEKATQENNNLLCVQAHKFCKKCIRDRELDMKLVDVEVLFDKSKIIFYFTAPTRIDFRELVKDLVREYRTRIELRQIGVRHETQMLGTLGNCGMAVCCRRYLKEFVPVTIKMAKEQNLFLNPAKISGMCGRLLCCLSYEQKAYEAFNSEAPKVGKTYQTDKGILRVLSTDMFNNAVIVQNHDRQEESIKLEIWETLNPKTSELSASFHSNSSHSNSSKNHYSYTELDDEYVSGDKLEELLETQFESDLLNDDQVYERSLTEYKKTKSKGKAPTKPFSKNQSRPREKAQKRSSFDDIK